MRLKMKAECEHGLDTRLPCGDCQKDYEAEPGTGRRYMKNPKLTKSQATKVKRALDQHDRHTGCYFWTPDCCARGRRRAEKINTWTVSFRHDGHLYEYSSQVSCSCQNYYYTGVFSLDGDKKNRRLFAKLIPMAG